MMSRRNYIRISVALLCLGSAILLYSCKEAATSSAPAPESIMTEQSENLTIVVSENGRKSYRFTTPLLEGYMLGRDPYREFRKGISITTYKDDSMTTVNTHLVSNYAIYYENRKLWEAKGDVVVTKADGTKLYTQQLFWNSLTKRIYSNVDTKIVTATDTFIGEGFESDEELLEPRFRRWKGKMQVDSEQMQPGGGSTSSKSASKSKSSAKPKKESKPKVATKPKSDAKSKSEHPSQRTQPSKPRDRRLLRTARGGGQKPMVPTINEEGQQEPRQSIATIEKSTPRKITKE